jgi:hypothetical protein
VSTSAITPESKRDPSGQGTNSALEDDKVVRKGFLRTMWRVVRQLFHETMGALFAAMGLAWTSSAVRAWRAGEPRWIVALPVLYAGMMAYFAVAEFLRSRKVV